MQLDKVLAFTLSLVSTMDADRYRRRKTKPAGEDYEADPLAALLKEYQMRMSLEYMFVSALAIAYFPAVSMAVKDRKIAQEERRLQARKQELELMQEIVGKSAPI